MQQVVKRNSRRSIVTARIMSELVDLSRRGRATTQRLHPDLSHVGYTMLSQLQARGSASAAELGQLSGLNKSTISRQLADLQRGGLIVRELDPADSRVQRIRPSARGSELLAEADASLSIEVQHRTQGWTPEELATFADLLGRYNALPGDTH